MPPTTAWVEADEDVEYAAVVVTTDEVADEAAVAATDKVVEEAAVAADVPAAVADTVAVVADELTPPLPTDADAGVLEESSSSPDSARSAGVSAAAAFTPSSSATM